jgi:hypothetical protein
MRVLGVAFLVSSGTTASCAPADPAEVAADLRNFTCDGGVSFSGQFEDNRAIIRTLANRYDLEARRSSLGVRYGSNSVSFAQDEERAVLVGAADGPYQNCIQSSARAPSSMRTST